MQQRQLGSAQVSALGLGCMSLSHGYGHCDPTQAEQLLRDALDAGYSFFDTASIYGFGANECLVGKMLKPVRDDIFLASKCGLDGDSSGKRSIDGSPENLTAMCERSLQRLQTEAIDLYYLHRKDPDTPIEESVEALASLKAQGKIRAIGLSEVSSDTIRRAHAVHPITAVQSEYSLWSRGAERDVLTTCHELGITFVPFSPVGRGMLTGKLTSLNQIGDGDFRNGMPRFQPEAFQHNLAVIQRFCDFSQQRGYSPAQLALAWMLNRDETLIPIPGTTSTMHVKENIAAANIRLSRDDLSAIEACIHPSMIQGERYTPAGMQEIDSEN